MVHMQKSLLGSNLHKKLNLSSAGYAYRWAAKLFMISIEFLTSIQFYGTR